MAAATVNSFKSPEGNLSAPLGNKRFYRWDLSIANTNTHDTGLGAKIVDWALKPDIAGNDVGVSSLSAGVFTFTAEGSIDADLLVWADL